MLVLTRKAGERIAIGDQIVLVVSKVSGNRVTVGIEAPAGVRIVRGELKGPSSPVEGTSTLSGPLGAEVGQGAASATPHQSRPSDASAVLKSPLIGAA